MPADAANTLSYSSRPVVTVDGTARPDLGEVLLYSMSVEETTLGLFRAEVRFNNWDSRNSQADFLFFERDVLDFGKSFALDIGPPNASRRIFSGRITGLEAQYPAMAGPELTVLAEDRFLDLRMKRRTRSWEDISDSDIVSQIAADHGLSPQTDLDGPTYKALAQVNQSDLAFLRERMAAIDGELWVEDMTLHAVLRDRRNAGTVSAEYGKNLLEFSVLADLAHQRTSVKVSGWNVAGKEAIDEEAAASDIEGELNGGTGGSSILGTALAERIERIVSSVPLTGDEAKSMAKARYRQRARQFVRGTGITDGSPAMRVGSTVDLQGLGKMFTGKYYVTRCRHSFDLSNGYRTTFDAERPSIG